MAETTTYITVQQKYRSLLKSCKNLISTEDIRLVRKAFDTAMSSEANSQAVTEKDIHRLLDIGLIITSEIGLGRTSIICLMLHRAIESGTLRLEQIKTVFGEKVAQILAGLRDISHIYTTHRVVDSENFRKLLLSFAEDVRVQLIFLAEKLYDLRHAETLLPERQRELARETSYIYIPFAHRLGLYNIKSEMEDLALRYGEPEVYKEISLKLEGTREAREKYINEFIAPIVEEFNNRGIKFKVKWRTKTIASILNKMRKKQVEFEEIYDIFAVRFILDSRGPEEKADCWRAYSIVADRYTPNPQRLRDWISVPKSNGYESLQTTVLGPNNRWVEVQIRTERMDEIAEKGFAAHCTYKATTSHSSPDNRCFGLVVSPKSKAQTLADLKGKDIAVSSATIIDFLLAQLLQQEGAAPDFLNRQDIRQIPVRLQMLLSGQIESALLPEPLVSLVEAKGARTILNDCKLNTPYLLPSTPHSV